MFINKINYYHNNMKLSKLILDKMLFGYNNKYCHSHSKSIFPKTNTLIEKNNVKKIQFEKINPNKNLYQSDNLDNNLHEKSLEKPDNKSNEKPNKN